MNFWERRKIRKRIKSLSDDSRISVAMLYEAEGNEALDQNHNKKAIKYFDLAIALSPIMQRLYFYRGIAKGRLEDFKGAIQDYNESIKIEPHPETYSNRAKMKFFLNDFKGAVEDLTASLNYTEDSDMYFNRGIIKYNTNNINSGLTDIQKAADMGNENAINFLNIKPTPKNLT